MRREIILTKDGSHTVAIPEMDVTYHSLHGAIQESMHVFINAGLRSIQSSGSIHILEMGFGTGLNALLTFMETEKKPLPIHYSAIELFPLEQQQVQSLNYYVKLNRIDLQPIFEQLHTTEWEKEISISPYFTFLKLKINLINFSPSSLFNLIYFDAFAPAAQPELWTKESFERLYKMLHPGGILVTYCSKGDVRRAMQAAGFLVEKIPGPPGKREMVRAKK
jgi:tRNA U34 5-methylaminomethyl-2-thiouridine-forming methyltransferase MnmC